MFQVSWRTIAVFSFVLAFAATALVASGGTARADGPDSGIHLFYTRGYYEKLAQTPDLNIKGKLLYHGGPVVLKSKPYAIYWSPSGHPIAAGYQSLLNRYFQDVGGTNLYKILTQYYKTGGKYIKNVSTFGGSWTDSTAYPHAGTPGDPLTDTDIRASVSRAIAANGWPTGMSAIYFVFTAPGIESCADSTDCTPGTANPVFCAYHGFFNSGGKPVLYANMPYAETWTTTCRLFSVSPNANLAADSEISITSHEHFEAVTDPKPTVSNGAWYDIHGYEISDKCAYNYGNPAVDGSNVTLNGHPYIVQKEWSNSAKSNAGACVLK
jgi:hypothetical protein